MKAYILYAGYTPENNYGSGPPELISAYTSEDKVKEKVAELNAIEIAKFIEGRRKSHSKDIRNWEEHHALFKAGFRDSPPPFDHPGAFDEDMEVDITKWYHFFYEEIEILD